MKGIIYKVINNETNEFYIGLTTKTLKTRKQQHLNISVNSNLPLHKAIRKYGKENFTWKIIYKDLNITKKELHKKETEYIKILKPQYNISKNPNSKKRTYEEKLEEKIFKRVLKRIKKYIEEDKNKNKLGKLEEKIKKLELKQKFLKLKKEIKKQKILKETSKENFIIYEDLEKNVFLYFLNLLKEKEYEKIIELFFNNNYSNKNYFPKKKFIYDLLHSFKIGKISNDVLKNTFHFFQKESDDNFNLKEILKYNDFLKKCDKPFKDKFQKTVRGYEIKAINIDYILKKYKEELEEFCKQ